MYVHLHDCNTAYADDANAVSRHMSPWQAATQGHTPHVTEKLHTLAGNNVAEELLYASELSRRAGQWT